MSELLTPKDFAGLFNGREYGSEISKDEAAQMKVLGIVAVYAYSDDNMEFRGAIYDEVGCFDGGTAYITKDGLLANACESKECQHFEKIKASATAIEAVWCEAESGYTWTYKTDIPHVTFEIFEDGDRFCRGIVFYLADVGKSDTADELEWLRYFYQEADFGPADDDVRWYIEKGFTKDTGKQLPDGYGREE